jgi:hypothetical protein
MIVYLYTRLSEINYPVVGPTYRRALALLNGLAVGDATQLAHTLVTVLSVEFGSHRIPGNIYVSP